MAILPIPLEAKKILDSLMKRTINNEKPILLTFIASFLDFKNLKTHVCIF